MGEDSMILTNLVASLDPRPFPRGQKGLGSRLPLSRTVRVWLRGTRRMILTSLVIKSELDPLLTRKIRLSLALR